VADPGLKIHVVRTLRSWLVLGLLVGGVHGEPSWRSKLFPADWTRGHRDAAGRFLHDFSYAGYRHGEAPLPELAQARRFAVKADATGATDAGPAIQAAIDAAEAAGGGVVVLPVGLFRVDDLLTVEASGVVLRGAGPDQSRIRFTRHAQMTDRSHLTLRGDPRAGKEHALTRDGVPCETTVLVADAKGLSAGDDVDLGFVISEAFVAEHGMTGVWRPFLGRWQPFLRRQVVAIDRRTDPHRVTLDVPLRYPAKVRDRASLRVVSGLLTEVGVEHLGLSNAAAPKDAWKNNRVHVLELRGVADAWVRNVASFGEKAHLASGGIVVRNSKRVTVADCRMERAQHRGGGGNGYLFEVRQSSEVLFRDCAARLGRHNFIQNWGFGATGCVWLRCDSREGRAINRVFGRDVTIVGFSEYHHSLATANLVDSTFLDDGWSAINRGHQSSGAGHTATECVFWNVTGPGLIRSAQYGNGYVIGTGKETKVLAPDGDWVEGRGRAADLTPSSLYEAQFERRTGRRSESHR
jgi:hypothetical protein